MLAEMQREQGTGNREQEKLLPPFLLKPLAQNARQPQFLFPVPCSLFFYPFKPVVAMPSTRYFCNVMNMIITGSTDRVDMANMAP